MQHICKKSLCWNQTMGPQLKKNLCTYTQNHPTVQCKSWDITLWELESFSYFLSSLSGWSFPLEIKRHQAVHMWDCWAWKSLICYFLYSSAQTYHRENFLRCEWKTALSQWVSGSRERTYVLFLSVWCYTVLLGLTWAERGGVRNAVGGAGGQNGNFVGMCWELKGLHRIWSFASWV